MALAERMLAARFNRPGHEIVDHHTFVIASDGDIEEGIASEASSLAGHLGLGRLIASTTNHISIEGGPSSRLHRGRRRKRYEAYGWHVQDLGEDISLDQLEQAARDAMEVEDRPVADHGPHPHRLRQPAQAGHRRARTARRSARTRSG